MKSQVATSRRVQICLAFTVAILATAIGWSESMGHQLDDNISSLATWFPVVFLVNGGHNFLVALVLLQFPLFALAFALGIIRWPALFVAPILGVIYFLMAREAWRMAGLL
jgi:hypothetical protein